MVIKKENRKEPKEKEIKSQEGKRKGRHRQKM